MAAVKDITEYFEQAVPNKIKLHYDNVGLLVGLRETVVEKAVVALDITDEVIDEAAKLGAQLIVSHHPLIFDGIKHVCDCEVAGAKVIKLIQNGISALCLHTNLDQVKGGVNDALAEKLGIAVDGILSQELAASDGADYGMGRFGFLEAPVSMEQFLPIVKAALGAEGLRFCAVPGQDVFKVAVCGGSGGDYVEKAFELGCDTLVTGDVKHSQFLLARARGIHIIDGGHFRTENVIVPVLAEMLKTGFPEVEVHVSSALCDPVSFFD